MYIPMIYLLHVIIGIIGAIVHHIRVETMGLGVDATQGASIVGTTRRGGGYSR